MNKTVLGVAMVVVFCITWWIVAGEAMQEVLANQAHDHAVEQSNNQSDQAKQAKKAHKQAEQATKDAVWAKEHGQQTGQTIEQARQAQKQAYEQLKQADEQATQARTAQQVTQKAKWAANKKVNQSIMPPAQFSTQATLGIGAGLLADVLLLVGALAWSKLTAKA